MPFLFFMFSHVFGFCFFFNFFFLLQQKQCERFHSFTRLLLQAFAWCIYDDMCQFLDWMFWHLPQISLIRRIFDMIANSFKHSARRSHQSAIEYLRNRSKTIEKEQHHNQSFPHYDSMTNAWHKCIIINHCWLINRLHTDLPCVNQITCAVPSQ